MQVEILLQPTSPTVVVTAESLGLGNVDNTSDADKPVSTAQAAANTADRARANHTGTQLAATISDFATAVGLLITGKADVTVTDGLASDITAINTILASNDVSLDELQEIVNYIKNNRADIDALGITSITGLQAALDERILSTSGAPDNAYGADGSYAIDIVAQVAYGPKSAGVWPSGVSFKGTDGSDAVNQIGHVFPSNTERDAYANIYTGMISRQIDTDADTQYDGANWVAYTGSLPGFWVGAPAIADVIGHLPDGKKYEEEA